MTNAKRKLTDIKVEEISFVDKAANKKEFLVLKSSEDLNTKVLKALLETDRSDLVKFVEGIDTIEGDTYDSEEIKKFFPMPFMNQGLFNPFQQQSPDVQSIAMLRQLTDMIRNYMNFSEDNITGNNFVTEEDKLANFQPEPDMVEKKVELEMTQEEIQKAIDDAVQARIAEVEKNAEEAISKAKEEADAKVEILTKAMEDRRAKEFDAKAEELSVLGLEEGFGAVMKALSDVDSENYAKVEAVLYKAADALSKEELTKEVGTEDAVDNTSETTMDSLVESKADEIQKADPTLTKSQAVDKALEVLISERKV